MTTRDQAVYAGALKRIEECRRTKSTTLSLSGFGLTMVPPELGQLTALTQLDLANNQLTTLPPELGQLTALKELNLAGNQLTTLPPVLGQLTALTQLNLLSNQLTTLPPVLGQLTALKELNLAGNQLTTLPPVLGQLTALTRLNLASNQLTTLPPVLGRLTALTELRLTRNQLTTLPPVLGQLTALTELNLAWNQLTTLPPVLGQLTALTELRLTRNQLTTLPPELGRLTALKELNLAGNQLTTLPPELGQLTALTRLNLASNQLTTLPPVLGRLTALTELNLLSNQLTTLPPELGKLRPLARLILEDNALRELPESLRKLTRLKQLTLHGNAGLGLPVERLGPRFAESSDQNPPAEPAKILAYYFATRGAAGRELREARIILIGDGAAGKTSVVRQLLRNETARQEEASTRDVVIGRWEVPLPRGKAQVNVWDFGGQKQMHAAHPYFFTTRTLYLVVAEARKDQQDRVDYWLKMVAKYGGEARALVVINKVEPEGHAMALDRPKLLDRYARNLPTDASQAFLATSCKNGTGIAELRTAIQRELNAMDQVWALWPKPWFQVKQTIQQMREPAGRCPRWLAKLLACLPSFRQARPPGGAETLQYNEWRRICEECGVATEKDREELLAMLGHLGLVIAFPQDVRLSGLGVLNPEWVTRGIYPLLVDTKLAANGGLLRTDDLPGILPLDRFPKEQHHWLIELMSAFELVFRDPQGNLLLPAQLPVDSPPWAQPGEWSDDGTLHLELRYNGVLPESVVSQFIVRRHAEARQPGEWWRHGVALKRGGCEALVRAHTAEQEAKIELRLRGPRLERRDLLASIRETLRDPRDASPPELYVILGPDCAQKHEELLKHAAKGLRELPFIINGESVTRELAPILDLIESPAQRVAEQRDQGDTHNHHYAPGSEPKFMRDDKSVNTGPVTNSQVARNLKDATNTNAAQPTVSPAVTKPPWWKHWVVTSLVAGVAAGVGLWLLLTWATLNVWIASAVGVAVFLVTLSLNPKLWVRRLFGVTVGGWLTANGKAIAAGNGGAGWAFNLAALGIVAGLGFFAYQEWKKHERDR